MQILLNGEARELDVGCHLNTLLEELGLQGQRLAVEVNQEIVPRSEFASFVLSSNDKVEIVKAVGGG